MTGSGDDQDRPALPGPRPARCKLPRAARLLSQRDFRRVYGRGRRASGRLMTVVVLPVRDARGARLGLSVSKDHGSAVVRNKIKRLLREAFRLERPELPPALEVVIVPKVREEKLVLAELRTELRDLVHKAASQREGPRRPRR